MNSRLLYGVLLILVILSSVVYSEEETLITVGEGTQPKKCDLPVGQLIDPNSQIALDDCKFPQDKQVNFPNRRGYYIPAGEPLSIIPGSGLSTTKITTDAGEFKNVENLRTENDNIIADSFEFTAIESPAEFSVLNPIDNTKLDFDIPKGSTLKIESDGPFFKITGLGDIKLDILSRCSPIFYSSIGNSQLQIEKQVNSIYTFSNGALEFNSDGKRQLLRTDEISRAEIDSNCNGFVCFDLGSNAKFDHEDKLDTFYLENTGKDYNFCFDKKGGDGYKIDNKLTLNNKIKLYNFKKDLVYEGFDENNNAFLQFAPDGVISRFELDNNAPSAQRISNMWMAKNFLVIEEKDHSYITSLNIPEAYTMVEAYEPINPDASSIWMKNNVLNFEGKVVGNKRGIAKMYPENHPEILSLLADNSQKLERIRADLMRWGNEELANKV